MGFLEDVQSCLEKNTADLAKVALFSATLPGPIRKHRRRVSERPGTESRSEENPSPPKSNRQRALFVPLRGKKWTCSSGLLEVEETDGRESCSNQTKRRDITVAEG